MADAIATAVSPSAITLEQMIALNDEIAALVRAGVPLERGLANIGSDMPGRLGDIFRHIAVRMESGESLGQALQHNRQQLPPVYLAIVQAGVAAGRLPVALEGLATSARRLAEVRQIANLALLYPTFVLLLAYGLFLFFLLHVLPTIVGLFDGGLPALPGLFRSMAGTAMVWAPIVPLVVVVMAATWWFQTRRALIVQSPGLLRALPGIRGIVHNAQMASLLEVLSLLVEHQVPLDRAIVLAAEASGSRRLIDSAHHVEQALRRGVAIERVDRRYGLPPLLCYLLTTGQRQQNLAPLLKRSAETCRRRALRRAEWLRVFLPAIVTVAIGGTVTLLYGLSMFIPMNELLESISRITDPL